MAETKGATPEMAVLPDDFIVAPQLNKVYVSGEVKRAGIIPMSGA